MLKNCEPAARYHMKYLTLKVFYDYIKSLIKTPITFKKAGRRRRGKRMKIRVMGLNDDLK